MGTSSIKALSEDMTTILANEFPIKSVKLFNSGSAEVTRTFPLPFLRCQDSPQVVEIVHLPAGLQSVDVSVTSGNVIILDHYYTIVTGSNSASSNQTLLELRADQRRLEDEKHLRQQCLTFLTTFTDSLAQCKSPSQHESQHVTSLFNFFVENGIARSAVIAELDSKLADVGNKIKEETERLSKFNRDLPMKVVTSLSCNGQLPVEATEFTLTYVVQQVSWKPTYDLHVSMTGNTLSPTVTLDFRCTVTQWTGENWDNVSLALTTANQVSQLIQLPEPKRVDVGLAPTHNPEPTIPNLPPMAMRLGGDIHEEQVQGVTWTPRYRYASNSDDYRQYRRAAPRIARRQFSPNQDEGLRHERRRQFSPDPYEGFRRERRRQLSPDSDEGHRYERHQFADDLDEDQPMPSSHGLLNDVSVISSEPLVSAEMPDEKAPPQTVPQLISHGGKDPVTHFANGSVFIPSHQVAHHVLVASLSLQAEFMRVVVPGMDACVYHTCEVKNTSEYVLLPGIVKIYLNDKHVSSVDILNAEMPQVVECVLAVDTGMNTIHNRAPDALPSITTFTGKVTTTYTTATVIHNTHRNRIRGVIVRSSVPLPADPRITIVLKEPAGLAETDEGSVSVKEGCLARWSTAGGRKGKQAGLFEWVCDVDPGTEVLKAVWEVCAPQDLKLLEQVHI